MDKMKTEEQSVFATKPGQNSQCMAIEVNSKMNTLQLPLDVWEKVFEYISVIDLLQLSLVSKEFQWIVQQIKSSINLTCNYHFKNDLLLNKALATVCTEVNINHCYWLEPNSILQIISGTRLRNFHVIGCHVDENVMRGIVNLHLDSFSFTYFKEWRGYFLEHYDESAVFLRRLNKLNLHIMSKEWLDNDSFAILFDVYSNVLQHCEELQHLKMFDYSNVYHSTREGPPLGFPTEATCLPKLKSLAVAINEKYFSQNALEFLDTILRDKVIPLEHLDFETLNCYLLREGIRQEYHALILPEKEALLLTNGLHQKYNLAACIDDETLVSPTTYKKICLRNLEIQQFSNFATKIIANSGKCIENLSITNCQIKENIVRGIEMFAINCPQLTELHLTISNWFVHYYAEYSDDSSGSSDTDDSANNHDVFRTYYLHKTILKRNETLLEALTKFKNLKKLSLSPLMLHSIYYTPGDKKKQIIEMPFWKVTKVCQQLRELSLEKTILCEIEAIVHFNTMYDIAHCKNLKRLYLDGFNIQGNAKFFLSKITKSCPQLENIGIRLTDIFINSKRSTPHQSFILEDSFSFLKNLKKLQ